jgi:4-amino-4-deoxy-L-arabinose transferase-like glycosyltransferase
MLRRILLLLALALFTIPSASLPFLGSDEPRYAQVAKEMMQNGDLLFPHLSGLPWFQKPVGLYWLMMVFYKLFGTHEFSARLPSALAALGTIIALYVTLSKIVDSRRAILACIITATTPFFLIFSHAANCDMLLTFCVTSCLCSFLRFQSDAKSKYVYGMYVFAAFGVLAKGFIALVLPGLAIVVYLASLRDWKGFFQIKPFIGFIIVLLVSGIWFLPISLIWGTEFWNVYFFQHQLVRYTQGLHRSDGVLFYLPVILAGTFPWTTAPLLAWKNVRETKLRRFAFGWMITTLLFFSFSKGQLASYALPAIPPFAILAALSLGTYSEDTSKSVRSLLVHMAILGTIAIAAGMWSVHQFDLAPSAHVALVVVTFAAIVVTSILLVKRKYAIAIASYAIIPVSALIIFIVMIYPSLPWTDARRLSMAVRDRLNSNHKLAIYNQPIYAPLFYTDGLTRVTPEAYIDPIESATQLYKYIERRKSVPLLIENSEMEWLQRDEVLRIKSIIRGKQLSIVELELKEKT